ncbi:tripartite tricarboxylate transporter substrate binding protein [Achromobacter sp. F4_2707]|uniref:tripartite tricarboxylate transporter substrate binding protein n=1 Tax=Achromobacter sp. F4_2707 TaxID=3114286 RepID=UPI0039C62D46
MKTTFNKLAMAVGVAAVIAPTFAAAQSDYPSQPISIIVPYSPGGTTDVVGRALAESMSRYLKQTVIIENKPGAAGAMGVLDMMNAKPDGYRLTMAPVGIFRQPYIQETRYDPIRDLTYIASFLTYDFAVTVKADSPFQTIHDLVKHAKENPGDITYSTPGQYTGNQVVLAMLGHKEGAEFTHIPYKGDSDATAALIGGHTQAAVVTNSILTHARAGTVRLLATADAERNPELGDVPTLLEEGYDVLVPSPLGIAGPAGLPQEIVEKLDEAVKAAMEDSAFQQAIKNFGVRPLYMDHKTYSEFAKTTFAGEEAILRDLDLDN